jgi:hypothetical protein
MTKIKYSKKRLRSNLKMGIFFLTIGIILISLSFVIGEWNEISLLSIGVGPFLAGIFMCIIYYFENKMQYLTLKDGELIKNRLIPKKVKLTEIKSIRQFAADLKLTTENGEFVIDTQIVDPTSLAELKIELKNYNLTWN